MSSSDAFPYQEPSQAHLLVLSSFLVLVNWARVVAQTCLGAGLLGEIAVGVIYGTPLADILGHDWQLTITDLGYIGLVLLVMHGASSCDPCFHFLSEGQAA
jgi:hypothetical protein